MDHSATLNFDIVQPSENIAEGELVNDGTVLAEESLMEFAFALLRRVAGINQENHADLSTFTMERGAGKAAGIIYGQAYLEKRGNTIAFMRYKLFDDEGQLLIAGMATCHC